MCQTPAAYIFFRNKSNLSVSVLFSWWSSPQTWRWSLQIYQRRPLFWWSCCPLRNRRPPWRTPPLFGFAETPETGLKGGCSLKSSVGGFFTHQSQLTCHEEYYSACENSREEIFIDVTNCIMGKYPEFLGVWLTQETKSYHISVSVSLILTIVLKPVLSCMSNSI